jgi:Flp pilus assembly pilin Flp
MKRNFGASGVTIANSSLFQHYRGLILLEKGDSAQMTAIKHLLTRVRLSPRGQTMTEYVMIVSAIAVVVYAGYQTFGTTLNTEVTTINTVL